MKNLIANLGGRTHTRIPILTEILVPEILDPGKMETDIENPNRQLFLEAYGLARSRSEYSNSARSRILVGPKHDKARIKSDLESQIERLPNPPGSSMLNTLLQGRLNTIY